MRAGAGDAAPTAPHATPPGDPRDPSPSDSKRKKSGPARFWDRRARRFALAGCLVASIVLHYVVSPWTLLPEAGVDIKDQAGDLAIPVDLIQEAPPEPPPPEVKPAAPDLPKAGETPGPGGRADAGAPKKRDAGIARRDAGRDAEADAEDRDAEDTDAEAADAEVADARVRDAGRDGPSGDGSDDGGPVPLGADAMVATNAEAGATGVGPRDPSALLGGAASGIEAGPQNVQVILNMEVIKSNPVGAKLGPLLAAMPQWRDFLASTGIDPVRDGDWFMLFGPSLANTERDAALIHFNVSDARAAKALELIAKRDVGGGAYDAGVPGVRAWRGRADRAARVFLIPRPHLAVVVPPDFANKAAAAFSRGSFAPKITPGEAARGEFKNPHGSVSAVPASITMMRVWAKPRSDGGADVFGEGDCPDAASATEAASALRRFIRGQNSILVQAVSRGALNGLEINADGSTVRVRATITEDQLDALYELGAGFLGVNVENGAPPPGR